MTLPHAKRRHYMNSIIYIGIDVHKNSYSYCAYAKEKDSFFAEHKSEAGSKKEFTRARCSKKRQLKKAKQQLLSFLLRMGMIYPEKGSYWTQSHFGWLRTVQFKDDNKIACSLNSFVYCVILHLLYRCFWHCTFMITVHCM